MRLTIDIASNKVIYEGELNNFEKLLNFIISQFHSKIPKSIYLFYKDSDDDDITISSDDDLQALCDEMKERQDVEVFVVWNKED
jgi:hypothetical protein